MISDTILAAKKALEKSTLFAKWKRDNPKEFARVEAYWESGGEFPNTINPFGLHYALDAKAYHESLSGTRVIEAPVADADAFIETPEGVDVSVFTFPAIAAGTIVGVSAVDSHLPFAPI